MPPVGVGIVGCAHACRDLHRPVLAKQPGFWEIRALYDLQRERAESEAALFGQPAEVTDSLEALLAREEVELVLVLTKPPTTHHEVALKALRAGKHVMVEKPMAQTTAQCDELIQAAREAGVLLTVHQNRRWDDCFTLTRAVTESGRLGEIKFVRVCMPGAGWDWGSHIVDWGLGLSQGNLEWVTGFAVRAEKGNDEQGFCGMDLVFDRAPHVVVEFLPVAHATGEPHVFPLFYVLGDKDFYAHPQGAQWPNMFPFYEGLYRAIREGVAVPVDPRGSRNVIYCLEMMGESARQGRPLQADNWLPVD